MINRKQKNRLLVFAKAPVAGLVKTRLSPLLTAEASAQLHCRLLNHCLTSLACSDDWVTELWVGSDHECWPSLAQQYNVVVYQQCGGDLGDKMSSAINDTLKRGQRAVVIGTDCPFIDSAYIQQAFSALTTNDVAIGPAADGGYVLIGLNKHRRTLFEAISWGSEKVLQQTLAVIANETLQCYQLPTLMDIDRPSDFERLHERLPEITTGLLHC